ncbi:TPR-like protein, partial [Violaceomyces palustris]
MPPSSSPSPRLTGTRKRAIPNRYGQSVSWSAIAQSPSSHPSPSPSSPGQPDQAQTDRLHAQYQHTSTLPEHQTAALAAELAQEEGEEVDEESDSQDEYHDDHRRRRHSSRRGGLVASKPGSRTTPRSNAKGKAAGRRRGDSVSGSESDSEDESDSDSDDEDDDDDEEDSSDYSQGSDDDDGEDDDTVAVDRSRRGKAVVEDEAVEFENETFTRLVDSLQDTSKQAGALRRAWDTSIEEETSLFESDLRAAAGFKKKKNVRRAPREQQLSHEVRDLLSKANIAYVESNLDEAIEKLEEVIRIEPAVLSAWKTLGLIYNELGQREKALQFRIIGAHLTPRASDEWKDLANQSRELGLYQQSIFCLQQAIKVDKDDIDAIWDRSIMLKDLGDSKAAINGLVSILERQPNDPEVIRELIPLLVSAQDYSQGVDILESSRRANMDQFPDPTSLDEAQTEQGRGNTFSLSELVTLADLLLLIGKPVEAVNVIRTTSRWLDGRASESYWDQLADDREFDEDREGEVARSREPSQLGPIVEFADPHLLDPEVRLRLGKARMMMGQTDEAKLHFDLLLQGDPADAPHLYGEIGDCLFDHKRWDEALDVYNDLANVDWIEDVSLYAKMGACYSSMGELDDAIRMYEPVVEAAPDNLEWRMALAEIYEQAGEKDKSLEMLKGIVRILQARREAEQQDTSAMDDESIAAQAAAEESQLSFFDELIRRAEKPKSSRSGHSRSNAERLRQQRERIERQREEDTMISWRRLNMLESDVFVEGFYRKDVILACREQARKSPATEVYAGSATNAEVQRCIRATGEWLAEAAKLTDSFRSTPQLFPSTK